MSDLSLDFCTVCGNAVRGVMSGKHCEMAYVKGKERGVCIYCLDALIEFRERTIGQSKAWDPGPNPDVREGEA